MKTAETILGGATSAVSGDPNALSGSSVGPGRSESLAGPGESNTQDVSSLATLWMAQYLIRLGHETGAAKHWNLALAMLDGVLGRLSALGLSIRISARPSDPSSRHASGTSAGAWGLHALLIDTLLDFAGLDYDAVDRVVTLEPALPSAWPHTGLTQTLPCGEVSYRLERPIGGTVHRLSVRARLTAAVTLNARLTCPGLSELGPWQAAAGLPAPEFQPRTGRLLWSVPIPIGESSWSWTWG